IYLAIGWDAFSDPNIAPDHAFAADDRLPAQNGRTRIDDNMVFYGGMSLFVGIFFIYTQCAQRHPLVYFYMISHLCGFSDDHPGAVVYAKMPANIGTRMDVNTGPAVGKFSDHPWDQSDSKPVQ